MYTHTVDVADVGRTVGIIEPEKQFAETYSFYKERALFARKLDQKKYTSSNIDICEKPFKLSIVVSGKMKAFGYEVSLKTKCTR